MKTQGVALCAAAFLAASSGCSHTSPLFGEGGAVVFTTSSSGSSVSTNSGTSSGLGGAVNVSTSSGLGGEGTSSGIVVTVGSTTSTSSGSMTGTASSGSMTGTTSSGSMTGTSSTTSGSGSSGGPCTVTDPTADMDGDGWSPANGDCNDCDPLVNPGAIDVPGDPEHVDHDCSGAYDPPVPCDTGLALDDVDANDAAKALDLCRTTTASPALAQKTWGVISAQYIRANGTVFVPGVQTGIQSAWGTNVHPQGGTNLLALSSGAARSAAQTGACGSNSCTESGVGVAPAGFPQAIPNCTPATTINDDVALELDVRVPTNAIGYSFSFRFYSMEFPYWICQAYNDQFVVLANPAPTGAMNGNIVFDGNGYPASPSFQFFDVCDPAQESDYAYQCKQTAGATCPTAPSPYCPSGTTDLAGTGFDTWNTMYGGSGATVWLTTQAPVVGGSEITLRFIIWDGGDQNFDSTTLLDNFQWITTTGTVPIGTSRIVSPK